MKNQIIRFRRQELDAEACRYFAAISGFSRDPRRFGKRYQEALALRQRLTERIAPRAIISRFTAEILLGEQLHIDGVCLNCKALAQIDPGSVEGVYLYALTAGDVCWDEGGTINMLYGDIWGTAYVDAGRDALQKYVLEQAKVQGATYVSDSFGPGYYGMPTEEIVSFFDVLDMPEIGINLWQGVMMTPLKSCAGIFVSLRNAVSLPGAECKSCYSQGGGCEFCHVRNKARKDGAFYTAE